MNCIAVIAPKKKTVGTAIAWIANQRTVKIGYVIASFVVIKWKELSYSFLDLLHAFLLCKSSNFLAGSGEFLSKIDIKKKAI